MAEGDIIVKKVIKVAAGHHGGAWKVAYADFVTAMMAFFLLLWLLNVTTDEQKSGIADYFAPTTVSFSRSGSGGVMGGLSMSKEGAKSDASAPTVVVQLNSPTDTSEQSEGASEALEDATDDQLQEEIAAREQESFDELQRLLEASMREKEELEDASNQVRIEMTKEGMRIEIVDQEDGSMFGAGNAKMSEKTKLVLGEIAKFIKKVPNDISITGHTDAGLFVRSDGYSNWELSSDRANTTRRVLQAAGVPPERMARIIGRADQDPLTPEDPFLPENRRISILLLRQASVLPPSLNKDRN